MQVEIFFGGLLLDCDVTCYPACRGSRDSYGVPLEPDEDASFEVNSIVVSENSNDLTQEEIVAVLAMEDDIHVAIGEELVDDDDYYDDEVDGRDYSYEDDRDDYCN